MQIQLIRPETTGDFFQLKKKDLHNFGKQFGRFCGLGTVLGEWSGTWVRHKRQFGPNFEVKPTVLQCKFSEHKY